jgi:hypothetical protein
MIIPYITTAKVTRPGVYTLCEGVGWLAVYRAIHTADHVQTIYFKDGATPLVTLMIPKSNPFQWIKLTKLPGMSEGIRFDTSLVVKLEEGCNLEIGYVLGKNAFDS